METTKSYLENNERWTKEVTQKRPDFFDELAKGQSPACLWIGCADSRVPPDTLLDLPPGSLFVHRNIANQVNASDPNCQSVIQYAVGVLKVSHIIVCGHTLCGGVIASMGAPLADPINGWLDPIREVYAANRSELENLDEDARAARLCELNVMRQVEQVCGTEPVTEAWAEGQELQVHGWIYDLTDGRVKDLQITATGP